MPQLRELKQAIDLFVKKNPELLNGYFSCEHDMLYLCHVDDVKLNDEEIKILDDLGFFIETESWVCYT